MPKGKLFKELGAPISNLAAGPKELHNLSDGRKIEVLNGRVAAFSSAGAKAKRVSEFNDFKAIENTPKETFTLSNNPESTNAANKLHDFLESNKANTLCILGGGIAACLIIAIPFSRSLKLIPSDSEYEPSFNREIPPFLQSAPQVRR